ncbi:MAG: DUF1428 domain-containing protein [Bdellovibrio sp.]
MAKYVDGFLIPLARKDLAAYRKISKKAGKIWMKYGALEYRECVGDDLKVNFGRPFPKLSKTKSNEVVLFSWIVYKSKAHRNRVNRLVMADPYMAKMGPDSMPFDLKKMSYGGFKTIVDMV